MADQPLPSGWEERVSRKRECKYYLHVTTGETTWTRPVEKTNDTGNTGESSELWEEALTADGKTYFKNHKTKTTSWTKPVGTLKRPRPDDKDKDIRCRHILLKHTESRKPVTWRGDQVTISKEEAVENLTILRKRLCPLASKELEAAFLKEAEIRSDCSSAKKGGDLGLFGRGKMQPSFEKAAFTLSVGELSDVISSESGVHIILRIA
jgi:NIMA-interacting peptidyl-prolyl cis-trans isomerase 1